MSRWFRLDDDVINDPKILLLPEAMRWIWVAFLCIASKNSGQLPSNEIIALSLRVKPTKSAEYLTRLVIAGLIDKTETGFAPHNWNARQYKSDVTDPTAPSRQKAYRDRIKNRNATVTDERPHTETHTHTQTEKKETREVALSSAEPSDFDAFWDEWPNKVGKPAALKAFNSAVKRGAGLWDIQDGLRNYIRDKPPDRPWLNPATFLNQNRWEDQPAKVQSNGKTQDNPRAGSLIGALDRAIAKAEFEENLGLEVPADNLLRIQGRSIQRS
jgi:hypothetical protein